MKPDARVTLIAAIVLGCVAGACAEPRQSPPHALPSPGDHAEAPEPVSAESGADLEGFDFVGADREGLRRVWRMSDPEAWTADGDGRWGYIRPDGTLAIPFRFAAASDFADGRALVLLDGEFTLVDTSGNVLGPLVRPAEAMPLPPPSSGCLALDCYLDELGPGPTIELAVNPVEGERSLSLDVRLLRHGALDVRERGYEGGSRTLVLPYHSEVDARQVLAALTRDVECRDISGSGTFPQDLVTCEVADSESVGEFFGIRRRAHGFEIHHTHWYG